MKLSKLRKLQTRKHEMKKRKPSPRPNRHKNPTRPWKPRK